MGINIVRQRNRVRESKPKRRRGKWKVQFSVAVVTRSIYLNLKPHFLKDNVPIIVISITIWVIAVFGFHSLLKTIEKSTLELGYTVYRQNYPKLN